MRRNWLLLFSAIFIGTTFAQLLDDVIAYEKPLDLEWKAAPWWVQKEEAAKKKCQSSCTLNSRGVNTRVNLCDDKEVCPRNRKSVASFANDKCEEWSRLLNGTVVGLGHQVKHQPVKGNWLACAVFCETPSGSLFAPRLELEKINVSGFFPDGVWCHIDRETDTNFYCQNNVCLPETSVEF